MVADGLNQPWRWQLEARRTGYREYLTTARVRRTADRTPLNPPHPQADVDKEWSKENLQLGTFPTIVYLPANSKQVRPRTAGEGLPGFLAS